MSELGSLLVHPDLRGRGVAGTLQKMLVKSSQTLGFKALYTITLVRNYASLKAQAKAMPSGKLDTVAYLETITGPPLIFVSAIFPQRGQAMTGCKDDLTKVLEADDHYTSELKVRQTIDREGLVTELRKAPPNTLKVGEDTAATDIGKWLNLAM